MIVQASGQSSTPPNYMMCVARAKTGSLKCVFGELGLARRDGIVCRVRPAVDAIQEPACLDEGAKPVSSRSNMPQNSVFVTR